jgi:glycosyltransferase involved in cell wall biosynthesis
MKLFVVEQNGTGGLVHYIYQMCTALAELDIDVTLITAKDYELNNFPHNFNVEARLNLWQLFDRRSEETRRPFFLVHILDKFYRNSRRIWRGLKLVSEWIRLTNYLIKMRPDIIQFGKINFPFESLFLSRLRRNDLTLTQICHEFERRESTGLISNYIDRLYANVFHQFSAIFFHAVENKNRFLSIFEIPEERLHIIPHGNESIFLEQAAKIGNPVDMRARYGLGPKIPVVLFFGILSPSKGIPDLIQAFAYAKNQSTAKLIIAGYPTKHVNMDNLHKLVKELEIDKDVIFDSRYLPFNEIAPLMDLATVVVFPYHSSTQSGALQVAYAFGKPVIATNTGGLPEVVEDGVSGFLVPPKSPEILAEKILHFLQDPKTAPKMGRAAKELSESKYSWAPIAEKIHKIYFKLITSPK